MGVMMQTAVLEGLVDAVKGFSCFLLRGAGCGIRCRYPGPLRASLADCRVKRPYSTISSRIIDQLTGRKGPISVDKSTQRHATHSNAPRMQSVFEYNLADQQAISCLITTRYYGTWGCSSYRFHSFSKTMIPATVTDVSLGPPVYNLT